MATTRRTAKGKSKGNRGKGKPAAASADRSPRTIEALKEMQRLIQSEGYPWEIQDKGSNGFSVFNFQSNEYKAKNLSLTKLKKWIGESLISGNEGDASPKPEAEEEPAPEEKFDKDTLLDNEAVSPKIRAYLDQVFGSPSTAAFLATVTPGVNDVERMEIAQRLTPLQTEGKLTIEHIKENFGISHATDDRVAIADHLAVQGFSIRFLANDKVEIYTLVIERQEIEPEETDLSRFL